MPKKHPVVVSQEPHSYRARPQTVPRRCYAQLSFESLESRNLLAVTSFQQGVGGYVGTQDTILYSRAPT